MKPNRLFEKALATDQPRRSETMADGQKSDNCAVIEMSGFRREVQGQRGSAVAFISPQNHHFGCHRHRVIDMFSRFIKHLMVGVK